MVYNGISHERVEFHGREQDLTGDYAILRERTGFRGEGVHGAL